MFFEIFIIFVLIIINGFLSMSEISVISARKSRLETEAKKGNAGAKRALSLSNNPDRFLSTVQIGITFVGIFAGLFGGETISADLAVYIAMIPGLAPYAAPISSLVIVLLITYFTLVLGELVPKRLGLSNPEKISGIIAAPMIALSKIMSPFVWLLSASSGFVSGILGIKRRGPSATEEDVKAALQEGFEVGVIDETEQDLVERVFSLNDRKISSLITHKNDIIWVDLSTNANQLFEIIKKTPYTVYPVADGDFESVVGVVLLKDLVGKLKNPNFVLADSVRPAHFLPENMTVLSVLDNFKEQKLQYALITDEFGSIQGIVTINDIFEALVGDVTAGPSLDDFEIIQRDEKSWIIDGQYPFYEFLDYFDLQDYYNAYPYNTLSGFILDKLGKMPRAGDKFPWLDFEIEVVDMDLARIDKVIVTKVSENVGAE
ncbi:hemolysin family protein [Methanolapillus millepedarum]|uniref:HlyC/CorC family transporter n=1 Tax=Methanolapillus millepedarum TaxID=3028296 RepID=A0AA96VBT8_9EURY|nr:hypothetical protein MsAc7_08220 [Methanosarcinaceae archaeon Ac7]